MKSEDLLGNGIRILITGQCNYRCYFCHNEGIDPRKSTEQAIDPLLIAELVRSGADDLTISGGEPLLAFDLLVEFLRRLNSELKPCEKELVVLTIVTNASLLDKNRLNMLMKLTKGYSMMRFNISMHTPDQQKYDHITGTKNQYEKVQNNIRQVVAAGMPVSLNFVLLRNRNEREEEIEGIFLFSSNLGVRRIKIIEFLLTELNKGFYSSFTRLEPIIYNNKHRASEIITESKRKTSHYYPEYDLQVSFNKCTCALGCINCRKTRELEIVPGNYLISCIYRQPIGPVTGKSPNEIAELADNQLKEMIEKYGNYSPSLVFEPEKVHSIAVFPLASDNSVKKLMSKSGVCTYREYSRYDLGTPPNSGFRFILIEYAASTHSKLVCYRQETRRKESIVWNELEFMDPVYEFSRTRAEINRKKIAAMGLTLTEPETVIEESMVVDRTDNTATIIKKQIIDGEERAFLEILKLPLGNVDDTYTLDIAKKSISILSLNLL